MGNYFKRTAGTAAADFAAIGGGTRIGTVVARADDGRCGVRTGSALDSTVWAHPTADCDAAPGDRVLLTMTDEGEAYLLAGLSRPNRARGITTTSGASAERIGEGDQERLQVRDPNGELLFEFDTTSGMGAVYSPTGDLSLNAPRGRIELMAADGIQCVSAGPIHFQSAVHVGLRAKASDSRSGASVDVTEERVSMSGKLLSAVASRAELRFARLRFTGERLEATLERTKLVVDRIETVARHVFEKLGRASRRIEGVDHRVAGRVVDKIEGHHIVTTGETTMRSKGIVRIDGKKINLG